MFHGNMGKNTPKQLVFCKNVTKTMSESNYKREEIIRVRKSLNQIIEWLEKWKCVEIPDPANVIPSNSFQKIRI